MKRVLTVALALAAIACCTVVWSQGRRGGERDGARPQGMGGPMMASPSMAVMPPQMGVINRLNESAPLTDDQMSKIKYAISKNRDTLRPLQQKSVEASRALRAAVLSSAYDPANVKTLAAAAEKAEADVVSASIDAWTNIRSILTADQAAKLQELMERPQPGRGQGPSGAVPGEEGRTQPPSNGSQPSAPPTVPGQ